jgi:hypothetical protein
MQKTRDFTWKSQAMRFCDDLRQSGVKFMDLEPLHTFGPRNCFHLPWGWRVLWMDRTPTV